VCVDVCRCRVLPDRGFKNRHTPFFLFKDTKHEFFSAIKHEFFSIAGTFFFSNKHKKLTFFLVDLKKYTQTTDNVLLCSILLLLLLIIIIILKIQEKQNDETCLNYRRPL